MVAGLTAGGVHRRVKVLGRALIGTDDLGPQDLQHFWATSAMCGKTPLDQLMQAGGWSSPAQLLRYIEGEAIATTGVLMDHVRSPGDPHDTRGAPPAGGRSQVRRPFPSNLSAVHGCTTSVHGGRCAFLYEDGVWWEPPSRTPSASISTRDNNRGNTCPISVVELVRSQAG